MRYEDVYEMKKHSLEECLALIESGDTIAVSGVATEPTEFLSHFTEIVPRLRDVTVIKSKDNEYEYLRDPATKGHVMTVGHFYAKNMREGHELGIASYIPSDLHNYMAERVAYKPNNVFVAQVADMEDGSFQIPYCKMFEEEAFACADKVILEVNPNFRRVRGGLEIPLKRVTSFFISEKPVFTIPRSVPSEMDHKIGRYVADLIHDGDCIQLGIGGLPDAVAHDLEDRHDLGIYTEMISTSMGKLMWCGAVNNSRKKRFFRNRTIGAFCWGSQELYDYINDNPMVEILPTAYVNDPFNIMKNENMVSLNTALEIDLTGQVCSESIGSTQWSGTGGATDFAYGAYHAPGGKGIIAINATAKHGTISRIVPQLKPGAVVSISRNIVDYIVTEYGIAKLRGKTIAQRVEELINVAAPEFREELRKQARELKLR